LIFLLKKCRKVWRIKNKSYICKVNKAQNKKQNNMKKSFSNYVKPFFETTYKINFLDAEENVIYSKVDTFYDEIDANKYARTKLATTSDECVTFELYEL